MSLNFVETIENILAVPLVHQGSYGFTNARESRLLRGNSLSERGVLACGSVHEHPKRERKLCEGGTVWQLIVFFVF